MNDLKSIADLRRQFADHPHLSFDEGSAHTGTEQRRHPRIRFAHAPTAQNAALPYRLVDLSQSGFSFFTSRMLERGAPLALGGTDGERFAANIVDSRATSFDSSFIDRDFRYQVHCQFHNVLGMPQVASLLGELSALTLDSAD